MEKEYFGVNGTRTEHLNTQERRFALLTKLLFMISDPLLVVTALIWPFHLLNTPPSQYSPVGN